MCWGVCQAKVRHYVIYIDTVFASLHDRDIVGVISQAELLIHWQERMTLNTASSNSFTRYLNLGPLAI